MILDSGLLWRKSTYKGSDEKVRIAEGILVNQHSRTECASAGKCSRCELVNPIKAPTGTSCALPAPGFRVKVGVIHLIRRYSPAQLYEYVEMKLQITYLPFGESLKTQRSWHSSGLLLIVIGRNTRCAITLWAIDEKHYTGSADEQRGGAVHQPV